MTLRGSFYFVAAVLLSDVSHACPVAGSTTVFDINHGRALMLVAAEQAEPLSSTPPDTATAAPTPRLVLLDHEGDSTSDSEADEFAKEIGELRTDWDLTGMMDRSPPVANDIVPLRKFLVSDEDEAPFSPLSQVLDSAAATTGSNGKLPLTGMAVDGLEDR